MANGRGSIPVRIMTLTLPKRRAEIVSSARVSSCNSTLRSQLDGGSQITSLGFSGEALRCELFSIRHLVMNEALAMVLSTAWSSLPFSWNWRGFLGFSAPVNSLSCID